MSLIRNALRFGYHSLPNRLRYGLDLSYVSVTDTVKNISFPAYLVCGDIRTSTGALIKASLIYLGELPQYKDWCTEIFVDSNLPELIRKFSLLDIMMRRRELAKSDLLLCPVNPLSEALLAKFGWLVAPKFVICTIDLTVPMEQLIDKEIVRDVQRTQRRMNFRFDILRSDAAFDEFYDDMLLPTLRKRHEDRAFLSSREALRNVFRRGYLHAAFRGNDWIAAQLVEPESATSLRSANIGWRGGSEEILKSRVHSVMMYELIVRAKTEGFQYFSLGSTHSFVNNGILDFKTKWGARPKLPTTSHFDDQPIQYNSYMGAYFNTSTESGLSILQNFPIFEKLHHRMYITGWGAAPSPEIVKHLDRGLAWHDLSRPLRRGD